MRIVAIGGGEIGRPGTKIETEPIDKEIIRLSGKRCPNVLFIPTASGDSESYYEVVKDYYGERLGCNTDVLYLLKNRPSKKEIVNKISTADIIYVGGGNTLRMLKLWRKLGIDELLERAGRNGTILSGISAGAICWFKYANSDSMKFSDARNPLIKINGLDFSPLMLCPHYDAEEDRRPSLHQIILSRGGRAIALENCSAIDIKDNHYRILTSKRTANAYLVYRESGKVIEQKLKSDGRYRSIEELLKI